MMPTYYLLQLSRTAWDVTAVCTNQDTLETIEKAAQELQSIVQVKNVQKGKRSITVSCKEKDVETLFWHIIEQVCIRGWEPYANGSYALFFRLKV